jgi:serine/threonine protein kinase
VALALANGQVFAGDYRIERLLGEGGMGGVYVATQLSTSAQRALKLMQPHLALDATLCRRFEQEARISTRIRSDHVVQVLAAGVDEETRTPYIVMELLEGETLAALAERAAPLPPAQVAELFLQLCHALAAAHAVGVVHRDLKPENVFVATSQRPGVPFTVKVLDFGIAKLVADAGTKSTEPLGTPLWMSPEQTQPDQPVTPASDVWALGLLAFYLLTGRPLWRGLDRATNPVMLLRQIAIDPLPAASERAAELGVAHLIPAGFDAWFARSVVREPGARFRDAGEAQAALAEILGGAALAPRSAPGSAPAVSAPPPAKAPTPFEIDRTARPAASDAMRPADAPSRSRAPFYAGIGLGALAVVTALALHRPRATATPAPPAPSADAVAPVTASAEPPPAPPPIEAPTAPPPPSTASAVTPPAPSPAPHPPHAASAAPSAKAPDRAPFDAMATRIQVDNLRMMASGCLPRGSPPAAVTGSITFDAATGRATAVEVSAPGFGLQACVRGRLMSIVTRPFAGEAHAVSFSWLLKPL